MAGRTLIALFASLALLAPTSLASPELAAAEDFSDALTADDDCVSSEEGHCALNALQRKGVQLDRKKPEESKAAVVQKSEKAALELAEKDAALAGQSRENVTANQSREGSNASRENSTAPAASAEALAAVAAKGKTPKCEKWTGGSCITANCDTSRGPTTCSSFKCMCMDNFCAQDGACVFSVAESVNQAQQCERSTGTWCLRTCATGQTCEWGSCMCPDGHCFKSGACVPDWRKYAANWLR